MIVHNNEMIIHRIEARLVCFLHKATIPKISAKIQQSTPRGNQIKVKHKNPQTKAKTKLAIAKPFDF
jgi:hypothetical protein